VYLVEIFRPLPAESAVLILDVSFLCFLFPLTLLTLSTLWPAYEREVLHMLASIRLASWLMAAAVAGGAVPFSILALLGF
jgi:hypothetical protein